MDARAYFKDKKITIMGLGLLGGVGDIAYVAEAGADIIATDLKSKEELGPSLEKLSKYPNIRYTLGKHELADFEGRDLIIKAPSTPVDSPYIAEARKNGTEVTMWAALFSRFAKEAGATIVGITGTRGKTTVTAMIAAVLHAANKEVVEGGNVQGTSVLPQLAKVSADTIAVLELDSWKLQGFGEARLSPDIAVFTTFYADHMNYYKDDMAAYLADKANIFLYQTEADTLVLGKQCAPTIIEKYGEAIEAHTLVVDELKLPDTWTLKVPGMHNRYNAALALAALRTLGVDDEVSRAALASFEGVPGRLELVREINGVKVYNDTTATTPDATLAALGALGTENTIVIAGGTDKNLDMNALLLKLQEVKRVILLSGTGTNRILEWLPNASVYDSLAAAVEEAYKSSSPGDTILFSPAFTSFGMFKNEYDRGDQFDGIVKGLE
jgi:UDP-N-acetylmuramoylalanine--D-glutamate ligase